MPNKNARLLYIYGDSQLLNVVYYIVLFIYLYRYIIYNFINLFYELHFLLKFRYLVFYDFYFNKDMQGFCLVVFGGSNKNFESGHSYKFCPSAGTQNILEKFRLKTGFSCRNLIF